MWCITFCTISQRQPSRSASEPPPILSGRGPYLFLKEVLPALLEDVHLSTYLPPNVVPVWRSSGAFTQECVEYLDNTFPNRWIGHNGPCVIVCEVYRCDSLDFFIRGHTKCLIYETIMESEMDIVVRWRSLQSRLQKIHVFLNVSSNLFWRGTNLHCVWGGYFE